jgi:hypothetical protein
MFWIQYLGSGHSDRQVSRSLGLGTEDRAVFYSFPDSEIKKIPNFLMENDVEHPGNDL